MEFQIVECYDLVTLTKESQLCKANTIFKKILKHKDTGNIKIKLTSSFPACNYIFKVNYRNTRTRCLICSKLTIKTPECHWLLGFFAV